MVEGERGGGVGENKLAGNEDRLERDTYRISRTRFSHMSPAFYELAFFLRKIPIRLPNLRSIL